MQQHRKTWMLPALLCIGLAGCGTKDDSANKNAEIQTTPIGYYSNEKHDQSGETVTILNGDNNVNRDNNVGYQLNGNDNDGPQVRINSHDNDGPLVELMDHSFGAKGQQNNNNQNAIQRKGNLSSRINQTVEKVDNVKAAETIIQDNKIIIGVLLERNENVAETKKNIQKVIGSQSRGKQVQVFTNQSQYNSIKGMNNDLKNGGSAADIENELKNIVDMDNQ